MLKFSGFTLATSSSRSLSPAATGTEQVRSPASEALKRAFDLGFASVALMLIVPLVLTLALVILIAQGRPILIRHKRVGRDGKPFDCLKFRTMRVDCDEVLRRHLDADAAARIEWESSRKLKDDPRVTPLGHWLRKSSIDEVPQFLNVLRGEMSLVGPRPIVQDEVKHYGTHIQHYYRVRPGLTGSWQVGGRSDTSYVNRVQLDADYVSGWSFGLDLLILAKTVPAVVRLKGSY